MKKTMILFLILAAVCGLYAYTTTTSKTTSLAGVYSVSCSSQTATSIRPTNGKRKGIMIYNNSPYNIYLSTWALPAAQRTSGYVMLSSATFTDNQEAYNGAWFGLGSDTISSTISNVLVIEKSNLVTEGE